MKENLNIDELLNGFIDGELTQRHRTEVQRLISHDPQIAQRFRELQKCKMLLGSLPHAEAPADMAERVSALLHEKALLEGLPSGFDRKKGAAYLLARRVLAAAAMIGLVAVLGVMVYTIVTPGKAPKPRTLVVREEEPYAEFYGKLELTTGNFATVNKAVGRAIIDSGLSGSVSAKSPADEGVYALTCSPEALGFLLADLDYIWQKFDSTTLFVETDRFDEQVVVGAVDAEQIENIIEQKSLTKRIEVAKNLALLNSTTRLLPGKELFAAINGEGPDFMTVPKPRLAWDREPPTKPPTRPQETQNVHLIIVIVNRP
jgi:hypothetical protein